MDSLLLRSTSGSCSGNHSDRIIILDGGTGTTLQDDFGARIDGHLWASGLLQTGHDGHEMLKKLHARWEEVGAEIVQTCTYQATLDGLATTLPDPSATSTALSLLHSAVPLVHNALAYPQRTHVGLSLGPYGATLQPGREYTGLYDPPFGPSVSPAEGLNPNPAEAALRDFHLSRLEQFRSSEEAWSQISLIMCETTPNLSEALALRQAFATLEAKVPAAGDRKPWLLSFVFPGEDGDFPVPASGLRITHEDVLRTALEPREGYAVPSAVGINCTKPHYLLPIVRAWSALLPSLCASDAPAPWLALYPDGGMSYDVVSKTWSGASGAEGAEVWAKGLLDVAKVALTEDGWGGVILGGCCKAGFGHIGALRRMRDETRLVDVGSCGEGE